MKTLCTTVRSWDSDWWKTQARFPKTRSERVPSAFAARAVKTKLQETQVLRIAGCFSCRLLTLKKVCQLCKQVMSSTAGYAECGDLCVVRSCHILAKKIYYVSS